MITTTTLAEIPSQISVHRTSAGDGSSASNARQYRDSFGCFLRERHTQHKGESHLSTNVSDREFRARHSRSYTQRTVPECQRQPRTRLHRYDAVLWSWLAAQQIRTPSIR